MSVSRIIHLDLKESELQVMLDLAEEMENSRHENHKTITRVTNKLSDAFYNG